MLAMQQRLLLSLPFFKRPEQRCTGPPAEVIEFVDRALLQLGLVLSELPIQ